MGAACPLDRTNSSLAGLPASPMSYLIASKNRQATSSAAERQVDGCPEPARAVIFREWMRSLLAIWSRMSS